MKPNESNPSNIPSPTPMSVYTRNSQQLSNGRNALYNQNRSKPNKTDTIPEESFNMCYQPV